MGIITSYNSNIGIAKPDYTQTIPNAEFSKLGAKISVDNLGADFKTAFSKPCKIIAYFEGQDASINKFITIASETWKLEAGYKEVDNAYHLNGAFELAPIVGVKDWSTNILWNHTTRVLSFVIYFKSSADVPTLGNQQLKILIFYLS